MSAISLTRTPTPTPPSSKSETKPSQPTNLLFHFCHDSSLLEEMISFLPARDVTAFSVLCKLGANITHDLAEKGRKLLGDTKDLHPLAKKILLSHTSLIALGNGTLAITEVEVINARFQNLIECSDSNQLTRVQIQKIRRGKLFVYQDNFLPIIYLLPILQGIPKKNWSIFIECLGGAAYLRKAFNRNAQQEIGRLIFSQIPQNICAFICEILQVENTKGIYLLVLQDCLKQFQEELGELKPADKDESKEQLLSKLQTLNIELFNQHRTINIDESSVPRKINKFDKITFCQQLIDIVEGKAPVGTLSWCVGISGMLNKIVKTGLTNNFIPPEQNILSMVDTFTTSQDEIIGYPNIS